MTDSQLLFGIMQNDDRAWRHICRNMKFGFASIIGQAFSKGVMTHEDVEDIFQEALIVLMQKAKSGSIVVTREGALFSYLVQIGKLIACNLIRKKITSPLNEAVTISMDRHYEETGSTLTIDEKQQAEGDFLDRAFDLLPSDCKTLLKRFYWDHKTMDEIANILGMRNADSAKTKKNKCMNKFKDIAAKLIESEEFAEDAVRAAVERAALRELIEEEKAHADRGICMAALDTDDDDKKTR